MNFVENGYYEISGFHQKSQILKGENIAFKLIIFLVPYTAILILITVHLVLNAFEKKVKTINNKIQQNVIIPTIIDTQPQPISSHPPTTIINTPPTPIITVIKEDVEEIKQIIEFPKIIEKQVNENNIKSILKSEEIMDIHVVERVKSNFINGEFEIIEPNFINEDLDNVVGCDEASSCKSYGTTSMSYPSSATINLSNLQEREFQNILSTTTIPKNVTFKPTFQEIEFDKIRTDHECYLPTLVKQLNQQQQAQAQQAQAISMVSLNSESTPPTTPPLNSLGRLLTKSEKHINHFVKDLKLFSIHENVLVFFGEFNQDLIGVHQNKRYRIIPPEITTVIFNDRFDKPIQKDSFHSKVTSIKFGHRFNQVIEKGQLPIGLLRLEFGGLYTNGDKYLEKGIIPFGTREVICGHYLQTSKKNYPFPNSITHLTLGCHLKRPCTNENSKFELGATASSTVINQLPSNNKIFNIDQLNNLVELTLGSCFSDLITNISLPPQLEIIKVGSSYYDNHYTQCIKDKRIVKHYNKCFF